MIHLGKIFVILFLASCLGDVACAQSSIGIRGGYATSAYTYRPASNIRNEGVSGMRAPTFSLVLEHFTAKNAGLEANFQWIRTGFRQVNEDDSLLPENHTEFDYLKIPVLASFYAGKSGRFQIKFGPHVGYLMSARDVRREFSGASIPEIPTYGGAEDKPRRFMYGLNAGAGVSKLLGKSTLGAEIRLSYDFTNPESQGRIFDMNFTTIEMGLTYLFRVREEKKED